MGKTIREKTLQIEKTILSKYAMLCENTKGRAVEEAECPIRTAYQRDRDRIIHSSSFRRLKHKTQVFLSPEGDHYRTRLTHTLEVSQIARTISRALCLNEDLTEVVALGHDLGHTPFGHAGERALNRIYPYGFKHYEQSLRTVDIIEKNGKGLNLTAEVRDGILCHKTGKPADALEGRVVKLADRIAYINHDIDDAIRAGIMKESEIPPEIVRVLGNNKSERINRLVVSTIENSVEDIILDSNIQKSFDDLRSFMFDQVYSNPICKGEEGKAMEVLIRLYKHFVENPEKLPLQYVKISEGEGVERAVCDYIAGMSDRYALKIFNEVFVPCAWVE